MSSVAADLWQRKSPDSMDPACLGRKNAVHPGVHLAVYLSSPEPEGVSDKLTVAES